MTTTKRTFYALMGNSQRLDGGSMFGNAPKALWTRWMQPDETDRVHLSCRCLLVCEPDGRKILFETGIGAFFEPSLKERYGVVEEQHVLLESLQHIGIGHEQIDVVVLSHLHFDHAGGLLAAYKKDTAAQLLFPNATYVVSEKAWERANAPHLRDRASFIPVLHPLLESSGRLHRVSEKMKADPLLGPDYSWHFSHGHTPGLMLTEIAHANGPIVFAADLIPGVPWVHIPITMGYDRYPEFLIDEKKCLLDDLYAREGRLFFTHDPDVALASLHRDVKGRYSACNTKQTF